MAKSTHSQYRPLVGKRITKRLEVLRDESGRAKITDAWGPRRGTFVDGDGTRFFLHVPLRGCVDGLTVSAEVVAIDPQGIVILGGVRLKKS